MATYFMFGKYSSSALEEMNAGRTQKAVGLISKLGGKVKSIYALLGQHDLVLIVDFPGVEQVVKASISLTKMSGISFTSSQALPVEEFDKIVVDV